MNSHKIELLLVGNCGGTNVGQSLADAATLANITNFMIDQTKAYSKNRLMQALYWRLASHRPVNLDAFSKSVLLNVLQRRPRILISTGNAPIAAWALKKIKAAGTKTINFSTDDPWNSAMKARFFLNAIRHYDHVFTPRTRNLQDFLEIGVSCSWLPFGYDDSLFFPELISQELRNRLALPILFVGGGDLDRAEYLAPLSKAGIGLNIYGSEYEKFKNLAHCLRGRLEAEELRQRTIAATINICLVRNANRDQHVMRTLEIAACGGCLLAEDTAEHRMIFGDAVGYFNSPNDLVVKSRALLADVNEQQRIRTEAHAVVWKKYRYLDQLRKMLE